MDGHRTQHSCPLGFGLAQKLEQKDQQNFAGAPSQGKQK